MKTKQKSTDARARACVFACTHSLTHSLLFAGSVRALRLPRTQLRPRVRPVRLPPPHGGRQVREVLPGLLGLQRRHRLPGESWGVPLGGAGPRSSRVSNLSQCRRKRRGQEWHRSGKGQRAIVAVGPSKTPNKRTFCATFKFYNEMHFF